MFQLSYFLHFIAINFGWEHGLIDNEYLAMLSKSEIRRGLGKARMKE